MRTRTLLATAGATAGLVLAGVITGPGVAAAGTDVLKVHEKFTATYSQDLEPKGTSMGDRLVFTTAIRSLKGHKRGTGAGDCVVVAGKTETNAKYHCTETFTIDGDQIFGGGAFTFAKKLNKWAIMGGTGRYRGASGEIDFTTLTPDTFADTFRLD